MARRHHPLLSPSPWNVKELSRAVIPYSYVVLQQFLLDISQMACSSIILLLFIYLFKRCRFLKALTILYLKIQENYTYDLFM